MDTIDKRFLLVESSVLPEVFVKVLKAKEFLAAGVAKNVSVATKMADISRSAFYKYKDSIYDADNAHGVTTLNAVLQDETGALQSLLAEMSAAGASVVTINQSKPENGSAAVSITVRTDNMHFSVDEIIAKLKAQNTVVDIRRASNIV